MGKLGWFWLFALFGQLWSIPRTSSEELSAWALAVNDEEAKLNLEPLIDRRSFQKTLTRRSGAQTEDNRGKAGPPSFSAREYVKEAPIGSLSQNMLLRRLWESAGKQYKKRRNLSQCFWKYCV